MLQIKTLVVGSMMAKPAREHQRLVEGAVNGARAAAARGAARLSRVTVPGVQGADHVIVVPAIIYAPWSSLSGGRNCAGHLEQLERESLRAQIS